MRVDIDKFRNAKFLSVTALNRYICYKFDCDLHLQEVYLRGEISNFKVSGRHAYFSLKDENSVITAMIFNYALLNINFEMKDGIIVQAVGSVKGYEKRGNYSIVINHIEQDGVGRLYQEFLELKEKLQKEGLFDITHKLPLPEFPVNVAVVTAATGDAIHDIISTFNKRLPMAKITLYPAIVQGQDAPKDLIRALKEVYKDNNADVIIIGRGGGSYEDLSCFNDEMLARTLFASPIPTVSGIGHDVDYTICDFVSSFRAPTPTGAAMVLTKEKKDVLASIDTAIERMRNRMNSLLSNCEKHLEQLIKSYGLSNYSGILNRYENQFFNLNQELEKYSPKNILEKYEQTINNFDARLELGINVKLNNNEVYFANITDRFSEDLIFDLIDKQKNNVDLLFEHIQKNLKYSLQIKEEKLESLIDKAIILNPLNLMKKGYAITYQEGLVVSNIDKINKEKPLLVRMDGGSVTTTITQITKNEE